MKPAADTEDVALTEPTPDTEDLPLTEPTADTEDLPLTEPDPDAGEIRIESWLSEAEARCLANDVLDGLTRPFKELPPKHFYDTRGSQLFERICELPEYYPTRTEREILAARANEIVAATGVGELVELGSGSADKARILLDSMARAGTLRRYIPFDVSAQVVEDAARELIGEYESLRVHGVIGDFERHMNRIPAAEERVPRLVALLGGTIGNFPPGSRRALLRKVGALLGPADRLLLGTDLVKDPAVIEAAYDDSEGATAAFNRNVLHVINRELDADFPAEEFDHVAFFDRKHEWIEMRLRARSSCSVLIADLGLQIEFAAGEELRTEISAKFTRSRLEADFEAAGLTLEHWYTDAEDLFALSLARRQ
ncbi:MAG: L-histidine N(alpha)-methyltransferase [Solirubrobacteraceae bacterium]